MSLMHLEYLTVGHKDSWDRLVKAVPESGFMQSWGWSVFKESEGQQVLRLGVFDNGQLFAGAIVYFVPSALGASVLELPHGPVLPWKDPVRSASAMNLLNQELQTIAQRVNSPLARIEPFLTIPLPDYLGRVVRAPLNLIPTPTLLIPLNRADDEILSGMTRKGRYNVRLAERKGVEVDFRVDEKALEDFYGLFELTFTRHNFAGEPPSFFINMARALHPEAMMRVYFARYKGMLISSAIMISYGPRATYLYGGSLPFLNSLMASYALHWRMMQDARAMGCREYDFYGIAPEGQPFHPYAKFSQFKLRFGGRTVYTVGANDIYFYPQLAKMWLSHAETLNKREVLYGKS